MLKIKFAAMYVLVLIGPTLSAGEPEEILQGRWNVEKMEFEGQDVPRWADRTCEITKNEIVLAAPNGRTSKGKFEPRVSDEKKNLFRFLLEEFDDKPQQGGGGPRKGICRVTDGVLEILETTSAADDFPKDFSEESKSTVIYWKLKKPNVSK
ncbi:MAG: hypothetical protein R3C53_01495 [Pirellulaceae bacterium]